MEEQFTFAARLKMLCYILVSIGLITFIWGFISAPEKTWANLLLNNFYFLSIAIGASFFMALQYIAQAGWSAGFKRVPEALSTYIPFAGILFIVMLFGLQTLYQWSHHDMLAHDAILDHKTRYLNVPFFIIRLLIYFSLWIFMTYLLRHISLKEDREGGLMYFKKSEFYSRIHIFILAITFSFASFDWLMSIDPHWYSTIFSFKTFASAFYHGSAVLILVILLLHDRGYFNFLNESHLHDFSRYIFMLAIIYGYLWFAQFMLIWYGNIPEETIYYVIRWNPQWKPLFFLDIILNWAIPFLILMPRSASRNKMVIKLVIMFVLAGHWVDLYLHIFPGIESVQKFGLLEVGSFIGFSGLFLYVVLTSLSKAPLIPSRHPYLEESMHHHF